MIVVSHVTIIAIIEEGQVTRSNHLGPMHNIFGRSSSQVVISHHRYSADVNMYVVIKAPEAACDPPRYSWEVPHQVLSYLGKDNVMEI